MNITLKRTDEQVELIKAMASRNKDVAYEAQEALAAFIGPVLAEVVDNAPTLSNLFTPFQFAADDNPSIPLDLYYDVTDEDYIKVYSTNAPGGLPSSHVTPTHSELKIAPYRLESAVDFDKRYASRSRLDVVSKSMSRLAQEILLQQENASATLLFGSIADAGASRKMLSTAADRFSLDDFNRLLTQAKRNNPSWSGGTPESTRGVSDLIVSPEVVQSLREMAYNPVNTVNSGATIDITDAQSAKTMVPVPGGAGIAATDQVRNALFSQAGLPEFYGISIMEIYEFGAGQKYTKVSQALTSHGRNDQVSALDRSRDAMLRAVAVDAESGSTLTVAADDQYVGRSKKIGFYAELEEGRTVINDKAIIQMAV
jgi:hypothetical protein